jgi:hypothetical protein
VSELSLHIAPPQDLLSAAAVQGTSPLKGPGGPDRNRLAGASPGEGRNGTNPFAALLSGVLQGAQPAPPATPSADPGTGAGEPPADDQTDASADVLALLALPGSATPLPAGPGGPADTGKLPGNTLPASGNPLPATLPLPRNAAVISAPTGPGTGPRPAPDTDALTAPAAATPVDKRPQVSLADLALSRPLEPAPGTAAAAERASADPTVLALAGRTLALQEARANQSGSAVQPSTAQLLVQNLTQSPGAAPAPVDAGKLTLRLTAADFLRGTVGPVTSPDVVAGQVAGQLAAFAASKDGAGALPGTPSLTGPGGAANANSGALGNLGTTTLPALQPLGDTATFAGGLADRLLTLGGPGAHSARLQLHPEHLGELNVEIRIDDGSAQVWFGTTTSQAHDAIQASLPRLRELFADQGIQLTSTHIDAGGAQLSNAGSGQRQHPGAGAYGTEIPAWQSAAIRGRGGADAMSSRTAAESASARLLDVWA